MTVHRSPTSDIHLSPSPSLLLQEDTREHVSILKALADPVRLRILYLLHHGEGRINVKTIGTHFSLEQPTVSYHLRLLREAKLVTPQKRRCEAYYTLCRETFARIRTMMDTLMERPEGRACHAWTE